MNTTNKFNPNDYRIDVEPYDDEEREFIKDFNKAAKKGELKIVGNLEEEVALAKEAAKNTIARLAKNKNINIRLNTTDINTIKEKATEAGLPYQTLIGSILHQYASGKLDIKL